MWNYSMPAEQPSETLNYDKGRRHGSGKIMYSSGKIKATYTMIPTKLPVPTRIILRMEK